MMEPENSTATEAQIRSERARLLANEIVNPTFERLSEKLPLTGGLDDLHAKMEAYDSLHQYERVLYGIFNSRPEFMER